MLVRSDDLEVPVARSLLAALIIGASLIGCDGGLAGVDGGAIDASILACTTAADCDDGVFCDGAEMCDPSASDADQRGCVEGTPPCESGMRCEELAETCSDCAEADKDGDGHDAVACGGDDCDDEDPQRFPGNPELCDLDDRDEDCDPSTLGIDRDGDSFVASECCNVQLDGTRRCGEDCADDSAAVSPDATEVCNGSDEDCDGFIDEGVPHVIFPDGDRDGFGVSEEGMSACTLPPGGGFTFLGGDCDDATAAINPGAAEACDGIDNDCDGATDQGCTCDRNGEARICGARAPGGGLQTRGGCRSGEQACLDGRWSDCIGDQGPEPELCDGVDDDCDGFIDEGVVRRFFLDADNDGFGDARRPTEACTIPLRHVRNRNDCDDDDPARSPSATETCDGVDDDCDGAVDETTAADCEARLSGSSCVAGDCVVPS